MEQILFLDFFLKRFGKYSKMHFYVLVFRKEKEKEFLFSK
jgi:hypothetical protein